MLATILSFFPMLPFVPAEVAHGAGITVTCTGSNDQVLIQNAINAAAPGDTVNVTQGAGVSYCDIRFPVLVTKALTLQSQGKDATHLKGPEVINVQSAIAAAQSSVAAKKASTQSKVQAALSAVKASATASSTSDGGAGLHKGNGTGQGAGHQASITPAKTASAKSGTGQGRSQARTNAKGKAIGNAAGSASAATTTTRGGGTGTPSMPVKDAATKAFHDNFVATWGGGASGQATAQAISNTTGPGIAVFANLPGRVTIQNFTITGFNNTGTYAAGGAIFVDQNTPVTIQNNALRLNAAARGGGLAILREDATLNGNAANIVTGNTIVNNIAQNNSPCCAPSQTDEGAGRDLDVHRGGQPPDHEQHHLQQRKRKRRWRRHGAGVRAEDPRGVGQPVPGQHGRGAGRLPPAGRCAAE